MNVVRRKICIKHIKTLSYYKKTCVIAIGAANVDTGENHRWEKLRKIV